MSDNVHTSLSINIDININQILMLTIRSISAAQVETKSDNVRWCHHHHHHHLWVHAKVDDWIKENIGLCDHCWNRHSIVRESGTRTKSCNFSFIANLRKWQMLLYDSTNMRGFIYVFKLTHCLQQWNTGIRKPNHEKSCHHYGHLCKDKFRNRKRETNKLASSKLR